MTGGAHARWASQGAAFDALPSLVQPPDGFAFRVQGSPVGVNRAFTPGRGRRGRITLTTIAREWKRAVALAALEAVPAGWDQGGAFSLEVVSVFASPLADADGPIKLIQDALQGVAWTNDRQVQRCSAAKAPASRTCPHVTITVRRLP